MVITGAVFFIEIENIKENEGQIFFDGFNLIFCYIKHRGCAHTHTYTEKERLLCKWYCHLESRKIAIDTVNLHELTSECFLLVLSISMYFRAFFSYENYTILPHPSCGIFFSSFIWLQYFYHQISRYTFRQQRRTSIFFFYGKKEEMKFLMTPSNSSTLKSKFYYW